MSTETTADLKDKKIQILLLTNRDSDNLGDQVIEACDISLISTVMKNLNISKEQFKITSRAASMVPSAYFETGNPELLKRADKNIQNSDMVIFGGAPLFNYMYQIFSERTAITLEIAQKYNKPVLFSAIGVENYHEDNPKCQHLKQTLNFDCVKQITTRDGFEKLKQFKSKEDLVIDKVSDPAVFSSEVFRKFHADTENKKKKIGIFILRSNGFTDNGVDFDRQKSAEFWKNLTSYLDEHEYDYELLTSGHFGDEAFMDYLIRAGKIPAKKCVFNMNVPEKLIAKISSYDAVISTRLHPSIISFSLGVPSLGIVWNSKVQKFYESIGYADRTMDITSVTPEIIAAELDRIISEGTKKDPEYLMTIYTSLFNGLKRIICPEDTEITSYSYEDLLQNLTEYRGTSEKEAEKKAIRKARRTYHKYNDLFEKNIDLKEELSARTNEKIPKTIPIHYYSSNLFCNVECNFSMKGTITEHESGSIEFSSPALIKNNNGKDCFNENGFSCEGYVFKGWKLRARSASTWYWFMNNGTLLSKDEWKKRKIMGIPVRRLSSSFFNSDLKFEQAKKIFPDKATLPMLSKNNIAVIVAEAVWEKK